MDDIVKEDRPTVLGGLVVKVKTGCGNMYVQLTWCHSRLFEVFTTLGKSGGCASCHTEATTRLITSALRSRISIDECIKQLRGLRCPEPVLFPKDDRALSCPDGIALAMFRYGKLSVAEFIELILQANDMSAELPAAPKVVDEEEAAAAEALRALAEQRREDGLYGSPEGVD